LVLENANQSRNRRGYELAGDPITIKRRGRFGCTCGALPIVVVALVAVGTVGASPISISSPWATSSQSESGAGLNIIISPVYSANVATFSQNSSNLRYWPASNSGTANATESVGFNSVTFAGPSTGSHFVNSTWFLNASEFAGLHCYNIPGAGNFTVDVSLEENVFDITSGSWLAPVNVSIPLLHEAAAGSCKTLGWVWIAGPYTGGVIGEFTVSGTFNLTKGSTYFVSTAVHVATSADESGIADMWVYACVNFSNSVGCHSGIPASGNAKLYTINVT
jgi:hypothetical protein